MRYTYKHQQKPKKKWGTYILILLLIGAGIYGWRGWSMRKWQGQERFTVIQTKDQIVIRTFDPVTMMGRIIQLPAAMEITTLGGRGRWRMEVLPKMAEKYGNKWVADSVADYLGVGYTEVAENMNWADQLTWWWKARKVDWEETKLGEGAELREFEAPDGTKLQDLAYTWVNKAADWFESAAVAGEGKNVKVVNTTDIAGLGSHAARVMTNIGIRVSQVVSEEKLIQECEVISKKEEAKSLSVMWIIRVFGCKWNESVENDEIVLRLGENYRKWWLGD